MQWLIIQFKQQRRFGGRRLSWLGNAFIVTACLTSLVQKNAPISRSVSVFLAPQADIGNLGNFCPYLPADQGDTAAEVDPKPSANVATLSSIIAVASAFAWKAARGMISSNRNTYNQSKDKDDAGLCRHLHLRHIQDIQRLGSNLTSTAGPTRWHLNRMGFGHDSAVHHDRRAATTAHALFLHCHLRPGHLRGPCCRIGRARLP